MINLLAGLPKRKRKSITPDRGKEFSKHRKVTKHLNGIPFYFADPHSPWQRGVYCILKVAHNSTNCR